MRNKFCSTYLLFLTCDFLQSDENFVKPTVNIFLCIHVKLWRILNGIGSVQLQQNELHQNFVKFHKVCHDTIINIFGQLGKKKIEEKMSLLKIENYFDIWRYFYFYFYFYFFFCYGWCELMWNNPSCDLTFNFSLIINSLKRNLF